MRLLFIVNILIVSLFVCVIDAKRGSNKNVSPKGTESDKIEKLKLPGRTVNLPANKEKLATSTVKSLRRLGNRLLSSVKTASKAASSLNRDIKAYFSSDFEVLLLRMTNPTEEKTNKVDIARFIATTNSFIHNDDLVSDSNTFRIALRKIWSKIAEKDANTVLKALHTLHVLLTDSKAKNAGIYLKLINKMSKQVDTRTGTKYFDAKVLRHSQSSADDEALAKYMRNLFEYVVLRGKTVTAQFEELKAIGFKQKAKHIMSEVQYVS